MMVAGGGDDDWWMVVLLLVLVAAEGRKAGRNGQQYWWFGHLSPCTVPTLSPSFHTLSLFFITLPSSTATIDNQKPKCGRRLVVIHTGGLWSVRISIVGPRRDLAFNSAEVRIEWIAAVCH